MYVVEVDTNLLEVMSRSELDQTYGKWSDVVSGDKMVPYRATANDWSPTVAHVRGEL